MLKISTAAFVTHQTRARSSLLNAHMPSTISRAVTYLVYMFTCEVNIDLLFRVGSSWVSAETFAKEVNHYLQPDWNDCYE